MLDSVNDVFDLGAHRRAQQQGQQSPPLQGAGCDHQAFSIARASQTPPGIWTSQGQAPQVGLSAHQRSMHTSLRLFRLVGQLSAYPHRDRGLAHRYTGTTTWIALPSSDRASPCPYAPPAMLDRRSPSSGHDPARPWSPTPWAALCQPQQLASLRHLHATAQLCLPAPSQRSCSGPSASGHTDYDPAAGMPAPAFGAAAAAGPGSQRRCISVPAAVEVAGGGALTNLLIGPVLQCLEAATLGQPFEVRRGTYELRFDRRQWKPPAGPRCYHRQCACWSLLFSSAKPVRGMGHALHLVAQP